MDLSIADPIVLASILFGSMIPYAFSALAIKSVGKTALTMIEEVRRQIRYSPGILTGTDQPNYRSCIRISTNAALREMVLPGLLVIVLIFRSQRLLLQLV